MLSGGQISTATRVWSCLTHPIESIWSCPLQPFKPSVCLKPNFLGKIFRQARRVNDEKETQQNLTFMLCLVLFNSVILLITISLRSTCGTEWYFSELLPYFHAKRKTLKYKGIGVKKAWKKPHFASVLSVLRMLQPLLLGLCWTYDARRK